MSRRKVTVRMISAPGCERCAEVEKRIRQIATSACVDLVLQKMDSSSDAAVNLGIKHGLCDVPAFVVSGSGFSGTEFNESTVRFLMANDKGQR